MHIYNILLNREFLNNIITYNKNYQEMIINKKLNEDNFSYMEYDHVNLNKIKNSLKNDDNIFIKIDFDNKNDNFVKFLSSAEFNKNIQRYNLELKRLYNNKPDKVVLKLTYIKNDKEESGYLLHFGNNTFVIIKNGENKISQHFAAIPISEYMDNFYNRDKDFMLNVGFKRNIIDIFNNQIITDSVLNTKNMFISDNRKISLNNGKFEIFEKYGECIEYHFNYNEDNSNYIYNFICLTDGTIASGNLNLLNYITLGILMRKETIQKKNENNDKIIFNLDKLYISKVNNLQTAINLLGLGYMMRNILVNPEIILKNKENIQEITNLIKVNNIDNDAYFIDFNIIDTFIKNNSNKIIKFVYKDKTLLSTIGMNNESKNSIPYNVLKQLLLFIINDKFIKKDIFDDFKFTETFTPTDNKAFDNKIKEIVDNIKRNKYYVICEHLTKLNSSIKSLNEKIVLQPNDYIYYIKETKDIILIHKNSMYIVLYPGGSHILLYEKNIKDIPEEARTETNIVYQITANHKYLQLKNYLENNFNK